MGGGEPKTSIEEYLLLLWAGDEVLDLYFGKLWPFPEDHLSHLKYALMCILIRNYCRNYAYAALSKAHVYS